MSETRDPRIRSAIYELLSVAFLYPTEETTQVVGAGAAELSDLVTETASPAVTAALTRLRESLATMDTSAVEAELETVFGHTVSKDCAPYEGEYGKAHVFEKSQTLADLSSFYSAFGMSLNPDIKERLDHISVELEFMHMLSMKEAYAKSSGHTDQQLELCRDAQHRFLSNHLGTWVTPFSDRLRKRAGGEGYYAAVAELLDAHMGLELSDVEIEAVMAEPSESPPDPEEDRDCEMEEALEFAEEVLPR